MQRIRFAHFSEIDRELALFVKEAYKVGRQEGPPNEREFEPAVSDSVGVPLGPI